MLTSRVVASTNTCNREELDDYGVTKFKVTSDNKRYVLNTPCVNAEEKVYDFVDILTPEEEQRLYEKALNFKEKTGFDFAIVTASFSYNLDEMNEDYAADFYDFNDFGWNGVIFFRNANPADPYYASYYFGDAQLYYEPDTDYFLDNIYTYIHSGQYEQGIDYLMNMMISDYERGDKLKNYYVDKDGFLVKKFNVRFYLGLSGISSLIISLVYISNLKRRNKMIMVATKASSYVDYKNIKYAVNKNNFVNTITTSHYIGSSSSSGGGGHHSSGGHSGGGHSGGGRHG
jgi:uncharacterized membrane protein YgcG